MHVVILTSKEVKEDYEEHSEDCCTLPAGSNRPLVSRDSNLTSLLRAIAITNSNSAQHQQCWPTTPLYKMRVQNYYTYYSSVVMISNYKSLLAPCMHAVLFGCYLHTLAWPNIFDQRCHVSAGIIYVCTYTKPCPINLNLLLSILILVSDLDIVAAM